MPRASRAKKAIQQAPIAVDSYSNPPARIGTGTPNLVNTGNYPLVRLTEQYPLILSLYRSSWIVRKIIDSVSNDKFKNFPVLDSEITPAEIAEFNRVIQKTKTVQRLRSADKWGRLFGGAAALMVIDGHDDLMEPLVVDDVEVGSYKGLIALDRWSGIIPGPEINSDINDPESFGLPTYYTCIMDAGNVNVHHSRIIRFTGRELPQWEVQVELYWGMSEVEIIFDELKKRDYSSWNIVSLLTRAQVLTISEPQLATLMSGLGGSNDAYNQFVTRMAAMSEQMNNQGLMVLGKDGKLDSKSYGFGGISDVYHEFMKDLAASTGIPYEVLFGREGGMGSGGELGNNGGSSLQLYDNMIEEKRTSEANPVIDKLLPVICMSVFGEVPEDLAYHWTPIRAISERERSDLGKSLVESVLMAYNADLVTKKEARKELAQQSGTNGLFSNITEESIAGTPDLYASEVLMGNEPFEMGEQGEEAGGVEVGEKAKSGKKEPKGTREGENVPVESKPIGVESLQWHKSKRITHPNEVQRTRGSGGDRGTAGAGTSTNSKSLRQTVQHSLKHLTKKPKKVARDEAICVACEYGDCAVHEE